MIVSVNETNIRIAARIHSVSWQESHRGFCSPEFVAAHTPQRQQEYLQKKLADGANLYMLIEEQPVGIVSVTGSLIEDLYVLPNMQNQGCGTKLLRYAIEQCKAQPTLWILENNQKAERLYRRMGFLPTGRRNSITGKLDEIEFSIK